jgi:hypothetical protein
MLMAMYLVIISQIASSLLLLAMTNCGAFVVVASDSEAISSNFGFRVKEKTSTRLKRLMVVIK